jgi:hypothetical protein
MMFSGTPSSAASTAPVSKAATRFPLRGTTATSRPGSRPKCLSAKSAIKLAVPPGVLPPTFFPLSSRAERISFLLTKDCNGRPPRRPVFWPSTIWSNRDENVQQREGRQFVADAWAEA